MSEDKLVEKISLDENKCISCGLCTQMYPDIFEFDDNNKIRLKNPNANLSQDIIELCPSGAIGSKKTN